MSEHNTLPTQRALTTDDLTAYGAVVQVIFKDSRGKAYVLQMRGPDCRALLLNNPESKHLRDSLFWHLKAAFLSNGAAIFELPAVEMEGEPLEPSRVVDVGGRPYSRTGGGTN